jgi:hypothetical protein
MREAPHPAAKPHSLEQRRRSSARYFFSMGERSIWATASTMNQARCPSGSQSASDSGIKTDCSRSHGLKFLGT